MYILLRIFGEGQTKCRYDRTTRRLKDNGVCFFLSCSAGISTTSCRTWNRVHPARIASLEGETWFASTQPLKEYRAPFGNIGRVSERERVHSMLFEGFGDRQIERGRCRNFSFWSILSPYISPKRPMIIVAMSHGSVIETHNNTTTLSRRLFEAERARYRAKWRQLQNIKCIFTSKAKTTCWRATEGLAIGSQPRYVCRTTPHIPLGDRGDTMIALRLGRQTLSVRLVIFIVNGQAQDRWFRDTK